VGIAGRVRPRRLAEEAQLTPHGKGASWSYNQLTNSKIATMYTKTAFYLKIVEGHFLEEDILLNENTIYWNRFN
jgi:hypothetical protein